MKLYISIDMEGIAGVTAWDECDRESNFYGQHAKQMILELNAACDAAFKAGATAITVKDAHSSGRNISIDAIHQDIELISGWTGHPYSMVAELDDSYDAVLFIGYHSAAKTSANPLSHTMNTRLNYVKINNQYASEFLINAYTAAYENVPCIFISGDEGICEFGQNTQPSIRTAPVKSGIGSAIKSLSSKKAVALIAAQVSLALRDDFSKSRLTLPPLFQVEISFKEHTYANDKSYYPDMKRVGSHTLSFESDDYFEVLRMFKFVL